MTQIETKVDLELLPFCTACPLHLTRTQVVLGHGNHTSPKYMFIGEAPGETEDRTGLPFQGQAGKVLDEALNNVGIKREEVYISNAVKCRPPKNRKPSRVEIRSCAHWLDEEIEQVKPEKIIVMGASAVKAVLGLELAEARSRDDLQDFGRVPIPVIAIYHPAACLHDPSKRVAFFEDIRRVVYGRDKKPDIQRSTPINECFDWLCSAPTLAVDTETTFDDEHTLLGIAVSDGEYTSWLSGDEMYLIDQLTENKQVIMHNAKFDMKVLEHLIDWTTRKIEDTYVMAYLLRKERLGLKTLAELELGETVTRLEDLTLGKLDPSQVDQQQLGEYCCQDAELTYRLYHHLKQQLDPTPMSYVYEHIDKPLIPVLIDMESMGVTIDTDHLTRIGKEMTIQRDDIVSTLKLLSDQPNFNPNSSEQMGDMLFRQYGLPVIKITDGGADSVDANVLKELLRNHPDLLALSLTLDLREITKLLSTYVEDLLERVARDKNKRVHTRYNNGRTETGRLSSADPNLQNIPVRSNLGKQLRRAFIPRHGWKMVVADQSQVELRIVTCFSKDEGLLKAFRSGRDIHQEVADIMGVGRRDAKTLNFGLLYGMGPGKLASSLGCTVQRAKYLQSLYFDKMGGVKSYVESAKTFAIVNGYAQTYFGRRQYLPNVYSQLGEFRSAALRSAVNTPIQGTSADIMRMLMRRIWSELREKDMQAKLLLQVHDEVVLECPPEEAEQVLEIVHQASRDAIVGHEDMFVIPLLMEGKVVDSWAEK